MAYLFKQRWYLQTWFIAGVFACSYFIVPFFIGVVLVILQYLDNKKRKQLWDQQGFGDLARVVEEKEKMQKQIVEDQQKFSQELSKITKQKELLSQEIAELTKKKEEIKQEIIVLEEELKKLSFSFYSPKYDFGSLQQYEERLEQIRELQKLRVKNEQATNHSNDWIVDGSRKKGEEMNKKNIELLIRAFNSECDAAIAQVKFNNVKSIEKRIRNAYKTLNNLGKANRIEITAGYLELKLNELYLVYEYEQEKQKELEKQHQQRHIEDNTKTLEQLIVGNVSHLAAQ
jgi:hypothetical protein